MNDDLVRDTVQMAEESLGIDSDSDELAEAMLTSSRSVVRTCMQIRPSEHVLVVTDPQCSEVGTIPVYEAAAEVTDRVLLMMMPPSHKKGAEPPDPVAELMRQQDVVLIATKRAP